MNPKWECQQLLGGRGAGIRDNVDGMCDHDECNPKNQDLKPLRITENHIAWLRYCNDALETCNSDDMGAFKVFRQNMLDEAYSIGYNHGLKDANFKI